MSRNEKIAAIGRYIRDRSQTEGRSQTLKAFWQWVRGQHLR